MARTTKKTSAQLDREIAAALADKITPFHSQQRVIVTGDAGTATLDGIPDGEVVRVFEDFRQSHVSVMRANGQLRTVPRACLTPT